MPQVNPLWVLGRPNSRLLQSGLGSPRVDQPGNCTESQVHPSNQESHGWVRHTPQRESLQLGKTDTHISRVRGEKEWLV